MRRQQSTSPDSAAFARGAVLLHPAVSCIFSRVLPVPQTASAGVVHLAVATAPPASAAGGVSLRQRTDPHGNLCLPGDGITGGRAAGWALDSPRNPDGPFDVPRPHWAFLGSGARSVDLPRGTACGGRRGVLPRASASCPGPACCGGKWRRRREVRDEQDHRWCAGRCGRRTGSSPSDCPHNRPGGEPDSHPKGLFLRGAEYTRISQAALPKLQRWPAAAGAGCLPRLFGVARRKATPMTLTTLTPSRARPQGRPAVVTQGTGLLTLVDKVNNRPTAFVCPFTGRQTEAESRATAMTRTTPVDLHSLGRRFVGPENGNGTGHRSSHLFRFFSYHRLETSLMLRRVGS